MLGNIDDYEEPLRVTLQQLSSPTLEALKDFCSDRDHRQKQFEDLRSLAVEDASLRTFTMEAFTENWNASQFWVSKRILC
ncbi:MAG: hypothetical protein M1827_000066 [Pycnora praestabilis]|nr:MAG: hypothetical protein M1827_000066 [Pycnora praestabilis]